MERMAVTAATGVLSSLLSKLSVLLSDQYKKLKGVRRDIESLRRELTDMNAALVELADREKLDVQTKVWRDKVREMAYDIEDIIDIFMHHHDQAGDDKDGLFQKTARKIRKLRARFQIAGMIQDIKARVEEQSQSRDRYKVEKSTSEPRVVEVDPRLPAMYEDAKRLVGIDGPREEIINRLMEEDEHHSGQLKVLSIVGFGGLGKTTLANQVYKKIKKNEFECGAFVSVSRTPHMQKILKDILKDILQDIPSSRVESAVKEMDDDVPMLINILRELLTNKRYFVVIDDLWSINDWDNIIKWIFVENNNASRVIITTRNQDVATACCFPGQGHVYQMQPLNELHSRSLFFKRLFDTQDSCPREFREISDGMLRKCKGVPLAITSIASLLANKRDVETWEKIHSSLGSQLDTNPTLKWMRHVLSLSYNDLSHELKTCLLYLGMYPEDYEIPKEVLVRKWMAEGFVREKNGLDLEEAAENCFNDLINRSMIQPLFSEYGFGGLWACQVHDLMLELIISKCKEENFITIIDREFPLNRVVLQVRRISHQFRNRDMALTVASIDTSHVRSYNSFRVGDSIPPFSKFELLRVLDMEESIFRQPPCLDLSAINQLFLLRYLRVFNFRVELPKKFGNLKHLMTIEFPWLSPGYSSLNKKQLDFSSLSSLRHLSFQESVVFKNGLSKLCNLRHLSLFDIGINSIECIRDLGELTNLRNLRVMYDCSSPSGVENNPKTTILAASLNKLGNNNLRHLEFDVSFGASSPSAEFWSNCFARPRHLQSLHLYRVMMPKLPNWIAHADRLAYARLNVQELRSDDIQVLAQLPCLIHLELIVKTIPENIIIIQQNTFHSLKRFELDSRVPRLTFEPDTMPRLQRLEMELFLDTQGAMQLQEGSLVGGIEHLASLEHISVFIEARCDQAAQIESAWRDAISRHPRSQAMQIDVGFLEFDEDGNEVFENEEIQSESSGSQED